MADRYRLYEATIRYRVYVPEDEDEDDEPLWASGSALAKALENYSSDADVGSDITVMSATVEPLGEHEEDD